MTQDTAAPRKALNPWVKFALELGPLVLFFAVFSRLGIFAATGVLMAGVAVTLARLLGDAAPAADHAARHRGHRRDLRLADADPA